jgi:hypothetical protein
VNNLDQLAANGASYATLESTVTGPALRLSVEGASQVSGTVRIERLDASESGASVLTLSGSAGSIHVESVGTSHLHGSELAVRDLDAVLSGVSQAAVTVSNTLAVTADGVSVLRYRGNPTSQRLNVHPAVLTLTIQAATPWLSDEVKPATQVASGGAGKRALDQMRRARRSWVADCGGAEGHRRAERRSPSWRISRSTATGMPFRLSTSYTLRTP